MIIVWTGLIWPYSQEIPMRPLTEKGRAIWVLALLSPTIAELLSGSSPPLEFFNPLMFPLLLGLYGAGVLVMREISVMWREGWLGVITLGAAYGILEEGVAVKSFFDPNWMDLGGLGVYGRYLGTNFVWAVWLTIFHSMISITLPIVIVWLLYPRLGGQRLLTGRRFRIVATILVLDVLVCTLLLNPYVPLWPMYLLAIVAVFAFVWYSRHIPRSFLMPTEHSPSWSPLRFSALGFMLIFLNFFIAGLFVGTAVPPIVPIALAMALCLFVLVKIREHMGLAGNRPQIVGFISGLLAFFIVLGVALQLNGVFGMGVVAFVTALFIVDMNRWAIGKRAFVLRAWNLLHGP